MKRTKDLFTEEEIKQMRKEEIEAFKRALIMGIPTSLVASWLATTIALKFLL